MEQHPALDGLSQAELDTVCMREALRAAEEAAVRGEVPVGAVILWEDPEGKRSIISRASNARETEKCALEHAECRAIADACRALGGWRLHRATMYVTLEPCPMCAGAIVNARIRRVCFAAADPKAGAYGSVFNLNDYPLNHRPEVEAGVLEAESRELLTRFFRSVRSGEKQPATGSG